MQKYEQKVRGITGMYQIIIPAVIGAILITGLIKGVPVFEEFTAGVKEGLLIIYKIFPVLVGLLTAIAMFRASGGFDIISFILSPLAKLLHVPVELLPVLAIRPMSGGGSVALLQEIISTHGADSFIGRAAAVMSASTETSFYVIALYMSAAKVKKTGGILPVALTSDFMAFILSIAAVRFFFKN